MKPIIDVRNLSKWYGPKLRGQASVRDGVERWCRRALRRPEPPSVPGFHGRWALRDVSFTVAKGEILGILGPNGSGKSTLLKILSRITTPTEGEAWLRGKAASLLELGAGFHPEVSGRENVFLCGTLLGMTREHVARRLDAIVEFSGLGPYVDTPVKFYSNGMYVRLGYSVAAHLDPDILFVDEGLSVGDLTFQLQARRKAIELSKQGMTLVFVSHNPSEVAEICHRVLWLEGGRVVDHGPAGELVTAYTKLMTDRLAPPR